MMRWLGLLLLVCACTPDLAANGVYGCADGQCPSGYTCRSDARCYGPEEPGFAFYSECLLDAECESGTCATLSGGTYGQCSVACTTNTNCPAADTLPGLCYVMGPNGSCVAPCDSDADCPAHHECLVIPMTSQHACQSGPEAWSQAAACNGSGQGNCLPGFACILDPSKSSTGLCSFPCGRAADGCPGAQECMMTSLPVSPAWACLTPCQQTSDCNPVNGSQTLECRAFPGAALHCVPVGWAP